MEIQQEQFGKVVLLRISGKIEMFTAHDLRSTVKDLMKDGKIQIILDLRAVGFIDSSGLGALINTTRDLRAAGGDMSMFGLLPSILKIVRLTHLDQGIHICETEEQALKAFPG